MPLDPSALLAAKPIQVATPMELAGQGLTLGELATKFQAGQLGLQQQQGLIAGLQNPDIANAMFSGGSGLTPEQRQTLGSGILPFMQQSILYGQKAAATQKDLADARLAQTNADQKLLEPLANHASDFLKHPDDANWKSLLSRAGSVASQLGPRFPNVPLNDPNDPQQRENWARQISTVGTNPETQQKMAIESTKLPFDLNKLWADTQEAMAKTGAIPQELQIKWGQLNAERQKLFKPEIMMPPNATTPSAISPLGPYPGDVGPGAGGLPTGAVANLTPQQRMQALSDATAAGRPALEGNTHQPILPNGPTAVPVQSPGGGPAPVAPDPSLLKAKEAKVAKYSEQETMADRQLQVLQPLMTLAQSAAGFNNPLAGSEEGKKILQIMAPMLPKAMQDKIASLRASDVMTMELLGPMIKEMSQRGGVAVMRAVQQTKPGSENTLQARMAMTQAIIQDSLNLKRSGESIRQYAQQHPEDTGLTGWQQPPNYVWAQSPAGTYYPFANEQDAAKAKYEWDKGPH